MDSLLTMNDTEELIVQELHHALKVAESEYDLELMKIRDNEIEQFCELIADSNPLYLDANIARKLGFDGKLIPPGYIMSLTTQQIYKMFIEIGPMFISKIKGIIHVKSEVIYNKPILRTIPYRISIETSIPKKKTGSKGNYYEVVFRTAVLDDFDETCVIDNHVFFLKL